MDAKTVFDKLKPMLAVSSEPFDSDEYIFEVKWDGFRCLSLICDGRIIIKSRNNLSFSDRFPELMNIGNSITKQPVILDGEIVVLDGGMPSFYEIQKRGWMKERGSILRASKTKPATYVVFDVLHLGEENLFNMPLERRLEILGEVTRPDDRIYVSEGILGQGIAFYQACMQRNLEGIVAKQIDSTYIPGKRSQYWRKIKKSLEGDFVICGFKQSEKGSRRIDVLLLGCAIQNGLAYQGTVGVGLAGKTGEILFELLSSHKRPDSLFKVPKEVNRHINWVEPFTCCSVQFLEPARDGGMRHPIFRGLREDLKPEECTGIIGALAKIKGVEDEE